MNTTVKFQRNISALCVPIDIETEIENRSGGSGELLGFLGRLGLTTAQAGLLATLIGIKAAPVAVDAYNTALTDIQLTESGRGLLDFLGGGGSASGSKEAAAATGV